MDYPVVAFTTRLLMKESSHLEACVYSKANNHHILEIFDISALLTEISGMASVYNLFTLETSTGLEPKKKVTSARSNTNTIGFDCVGAIGIDFCF